MQVYCMCWLQRLDNVNIITAFTTECILLHYRVQQQKLRRIAHILKQGSLLCDTTEGRMLGKATRGRLEKVALDGSVECCAPPPRWRDLEL